MSHHRNLIRLIAVNNALGELKEKVVYVGGATVSLYADRTTFEVRPTDDVDVIIEILNYNHRSLIENKLRDLGFENDITSSIVCRYKIQGIIVDIMPTLPDTIGFANIWYHEGFHNAIEYQIDKTDSIKILSTPYFIATKFEAFKGRGNNDGRTSHDFEDIVYVLENKSKVWHELNNAKESVREYLRNEFKLLFENSNLFEWIDCHVENSERPATYYIMEQIETFILSK